MKRERRYSSYILLRETDDKGKISYSVVQEVDSGTEANKEAVKIAENNPGKAFVAANLWPPILAKEIRKVVFINPDDPTDPGTDTVEVDEEDDGENSNGDTKDTKKDSTPKITKVNTKSDQKSLPTDAPTSTKPQNATVAKPESVKPEPAKPEPTKSEPKKKEDSKKASSADDSFLGLFGKKDEKAEEEPAGFVNEDKEEKTEDEDESNTKIPSLF